MTRFVSFCPALKDTELGIVNSPEGSLAVTDTVTAPSEFIRFTGILKVLEVRESSTVAGNSLLKKTCSPETVAQL